MAVKHETFLLIVDIESLTKEIQELNKRIVANLASGDEHPFLKSDYENLHRKREKLYVDLGKDIFLILDEYPDVLSRGLDDD